MRIARATTCGLAGLLLGGPGVAIIAIALVPLLLMTLRAVGRPAFVATVAYNGYADERT
jgi:hypothetical protein